jgi:polysaccharide export outer membrane protein
MTALKHFLGSALPRACALLLALFALSACELVEPELEPGIAISDADARAQKAIVQRQSNYRLRAGDTISVFVFDNPDISQTVVVAPDGRVSYPLAGTFRAEGKTLAETRAILASRFSNNIVAPQVSVSLASIGAYTVYVNGEVLQPGAFNLQQPTTLVQVITRAGGFTAFARRDKIFIYNPTSRDGARRVFNYDQFIADPRQQDILLKPGDTIIVL